MPSSALCPIATARPIELFVDWLFYALHLRTVFAKTGLQPSKVQKPTVRAGFRGSLAYVFAARRTLGHLFTANSEA